MRTFLQAGVLGLLVFACTPEGREFEPIEDAGVADGPVQDGGSPDSGFGGIDAQPEDAGTFVTVEHERELRGAWIATVSNINFPSQQGLSVSAQQAELTAILDRMAEANLNAAFFQVRPEGDALYQSDLEPWSRFLTGTQGADPGYDPLTFLIAEAHPRNIEVHAWLNPYRAKSNRSSSAVAPHISVVASEHAHPYGSALWMDPAAPAVRQRTVAVIHDIVRRYDVDGIHFDDYFYPYPDSTPFPDDSTWAAYQTSGGTMSRDDWRRNNVHLLVEAVSATVAAAKPHVRFGISPFGIYRPGTPPGIVGLDQYAAIYSDPLRWMDEGWVDYLAPQLYWPSTQTPQAYGTLIAWWASIAKEGRYIFAGNYLSRLGDTAAWTIAEFRTQVELSRQHRDQGSYGNIYFSVAPLMEDRDGIATLFREELYPASVLTPPLAAASETTAPPKVTPVAGGVDLSHPDPIRAYLVYASSGSEWTLHQILPGDEHQVTLAPGTWAVSAAALNNVESLGAVVLVQ